MALLDQLKSLIEEPPPPFAFELSEAGVAYAQRRKPDPVIDFRPFPAPAIQASPVRENIVDAEVLSAHIAGLPVADGKRRGDAALILPDYSARVALLDFESFPKDPAEQAALVRFRLKKAVPFETDAAAISYQAHKGPGQTIEVLVAAAAMEIVSKYEAPFRAAGYQPGFVTTSMLATLDLLPKEGLQVCAKVCGQTLTVAVCQGRSPRLVRCVELDGFTAEEMMGVLYPTFAYAEDELKQRPARMFVAGFDMLDNWAAKQCETEMGIRFEPLKSDWGPAAEVNAGLLGWLQAQKEGN